MEKALKDTIIAKQYGLSLKRFFKDCFKYWNECYLIPFDHILHIKKYIFDYIKSSCKHLQHLQHLQSSLDNIDFQIERL